MKIILDVTRVVRRVTKGQVLTGIDRVTMAYVQYYSDASALVRWCGHSWVLSPQQSKKLFNYLETPGSLFKLIYHVIRGIIENKKNDGRAFLLNTGHVGLNQSDYKRLMHKRGVKPVFFVHDLIPIIHPEYCSLGEDLRQKEKTNHILSLGCGIITNSKATLDDLLTYSHQSQKMLPQTEVALLGPGFSMATPGQSPLKKPYFVILSTIEPRKNHLLLLQIWRKLFQELGSQTPHLFIIGKRGWECENAVDLLERCAFLKEVVTEVSLCSDAELVTYLYYCKALLFPSFIEGYGLPLIESLSLGTPVIASDLSVFREIANDIPEYVDPLDGKKWEQLIIEYAQSESTKRAAQIKRMNHLKIPTWAEHFSKVNSFLEKL